MSGAKMVQTYQGPYRLLEHTGAWSSEVTDAYRASDCDGLRWHYKRRPTKQPFDISRIEELPALHLLNCSVRDADDAIVAGLVDLTWLDLLTRSRQPLDLSALTQLTTANLDDRQGLRGFPQSLETLTLALSERQDLTWLEGLKRLQALKVEGRGQLLTLADIPELPTLRDLFLDQVLVETGGKLDLPRLEHVHIYSQRPGETRFDASVFSACRSLKSIRVRGPVDFEGLDALHGLPNLDVVAVIGPKKPPVDFGQLRYVPWDGSR